MVHLRFKRAATCVRWSPDGESFAVGGSEGIVAIGSYDASDDWWVCHHVRNKINPSPILSLSWHPSSTAIAISCLSGAIHLISADGSKTLKGWEQFLANNSNLDDQETSDHLKPEALRPSSAKTDVLSSTRMGCWIHSLSWSPSGLVLAAAAHAGTVFILEPNEIISVDLCKGPLRSVLLIDDSKISACGFSSLNSTPMVISKSSGQWKLDKVASLINSFDNENEKQVGSVFKGAFAKFKALDLSGSSESQFPAKSKDACAHAKGVSSMCLLPNEKLQFSTCGLDGRILVWTL